MRRILNNVQAAWRTRWWRWSLVAAALLIVGGATAKGISADDKQLQRRANQAQILGLALPIITGMFNLVGQARQRQGGVPLEEAADILAAKVGRVEGLVRLALLGDTTITASVPFKLEHLHRQAARPAGQSLVYWQADRDGPAGDLEGIEAFYAGLNTGRLVIVGEPGAGKTVIAIELLLRLLKRRAKTDPPKELVPIRVSLAGWDTSRRELEDWLAEQLTTVYQFDPAGAQAMVEAHEVLPILDGLDEMDSDPPAGQPPSRPQRALAALAKLNAYLDGSGARAAVVVTCRERRYEQILQLEQGLKDATRVRILPLTPARIRRYLADRFRDQPRQLAAWQPVLAQLDTPAGAAARLVLATPWRLHLAIVRSEAGGEDDRPLAELLKASEAEDPMVAARRIDALLLADYVRAVTELAALRQLTPRYDPDKVAGWLRRLAAHLDWQAEQARGKNPPAGLSGTDLVPHLLWPIGGWRRVLALHFAIGFLGMIIGIIALAWVVVGSPGVMVSNIRQFFSNIESLPLPIIVVQTLAVIGAPIILWLTIRQCLVTWPSPDFAARRVGSTRHQLGAGLGGGLALGLVAWLLAWLMGGTPTLLRAYALTGAVLGVFVGVLMTRFSPWSEEADIVSPRSPLHLELWGLLLIGAVRGLGVSLVYVFATGIGPKLGAGLVIALVVGPLYELLVSAPAWTRYMLGLAMAASKALLPWRLGRFMDWAWQVGLLRVAGSAYQFRHLELQHWLARQQPEPPLTANLNRKPAGQTRR